MNNSSVEARIPREARDYAKELTASYHNLPGATSTDPEIRGDIKRAYDALKNAPEAFKAFDSLLDALTFAASSPELDSVIELPKQDSGSQFAAIWDIPTALMAGARLVVAHNHIDSVYEAVTGKKSPFREAADEDTTDTIEEV